MKTKEIEVRREGVILSGTLHIPENAMTPTPTIIVAHGAQMGLRDHWLYQHLIDTVSPLGVAVFVSDRRGSGRSGGDFETATFDVLADDLLLFVESLVEQNLADREKICLWGFSQGGWIAPQAAKKSELVKFLILVSSTPFTVMDQMAYTLKEYLREEGVAEPDIAEAVRVGRSMGEYYMGKVSKQQLSEIIRSCNEEPWFAQAGLPQESDIPDNPEKTKWYCEISFKPDYVETLSLPVLLINGDSDPWVDSAASLEFWKQNNRTAERHLIGDANHYMVSAGVNGRSATEGEALAEYTEKLRKWVEKNII